MAAFAGLAATVGLLAGIDPRIAIGVTLGLNFLLLAFVNLAAGLVAFVLLSFLEFVLPTGSALSLIRVAGLILTLAWLAKIATGQRERVFFSDHPGATGVLAGFLVWGALSINWSESPTGTLLDLSRYLQMMALLVIAYSAIQTRRHVHWIAGTFLVGIVITAVYGLAARPPIDPADLRIESTVGDANGVAAFLVVGLALAIAVALGRRRAPLTRLALISAVPLFLATFVYTGSRSGIVSLAVALVATVAFAGRWRMQAFATALATGLIAVAVFVTFAPVGIKERISETTAGQATSAEGRVPLWEIAWRMFEDEPIRGVGLGSFQTTSVRYFLEPGVLVRSDEQLDEPEVAHNVFLQVLAEEGIVGEILFLGVLGFPLVCALKAAGAFARRGDRELEILARGLAVAIVAFYASNTFNPGQFTKLLWVLMGLGPCLLALSRLSLHDPAEGATNPRTDPRTTIRPASP